MLGPARSLNHYLPNELLQSVFGYFQEQKEILTISKVCRCWLLLVKGLPVYLDRIAFFNVDRFESLPKEVFPLSLKAFVFFQDRLIGQTIENTLVIYNPKTAEKRLLDFTPPYQWEVIGEFLTSRVACVFKFSSFHVYQIDLLREKVEKIHIARRCPLLQMALLKTKLYFYEENDVSQFILSKIKEIDRWTLLPHLKVTRYDLIKKTSEEFIYSTRYRPKLYPIPGQDQIVMKDRHWICLLDADFKEVEHTSTYWMFGTIHVQVVAKTVLIEYSRENIAVKDLGDHRNYGERKFKLSGEGRLHPFFGEGHGWKFLRKDGLYWNHSLWFLEETRLKRVNLTP